MLFCQQNDRCIRKRRQIYKETGSINGMMYSDAWFQPINEGDEVVIMPPIEGG